MNAAGWRPGLKDSNSKKRPVCFFFFDFDSKMTRWDGILLEMGIRWRPDADYINACISPTFNRIFAPSASGRERGSRFEVRGSDLLYGGVDRIISSFFLSAPHLPFFSKARAHIVRMLARSHARASFHQIRGDLALS